jgi:NADH-quinone oxidoreductase subunit H
MDFVNAIWWQQLFVLPTHQIPWWAEVVRSILRLALGVAVGLGSVPVLVWLERRMLGWAQGRLGPNRVGPQGLFQPIADALKLFFKEDIIPTNVDRTLYIIAPGVALAPIIMSLTVLPWNGSREWGAIAPSIDIGILFLLAVASIEVYGVILAGWSSNNKYSLLGGLRASSQVISYELGMGLAIIAVILMSGTLSPQGIVMGYDLAQPHVLAADTTLSNGQALMHVVPVHGTNYTFYEQSGYSTFLDWNWFRLFPFGLIAALIYMVSMIAETNRAPFDLPEAETELVAGFHTEYSSFKFAMFFMGEYANMMIVSAICVTLFFGGWLAPWGILNQVPVGWISYFPSWFGAPAANVINSFVISPIWFFGKLYGLISFFILVRASYPRLRYDMLMRFGWKVMLPTALANLVCIAVSLAVQEEYASLGSLGSWWIGQLAAWILMTIFLVLVGFALYRGYEERRTAAQTTDIAPIRRSPVAVAVEPVVTPEG